MLDGQPNQRSERARVAILAAAVDECLAVGYERTSVEGIARRSHSGKQTLYRRWPSKAAVLLDALVESLGDTTDFPDSGDVVADMRNQMHGVVRFFTDARHGAVYRALIAAGQSDASELRALLERLVEPRRAMALELLRSAQRDGRLLADISASTLLDLLYAPLYYRLLITQEPITEGLADALVEAVLQRLAAARPLLGPGVQQLVATADRQQRRGGALARLADAEATRRAAADEVDRQAKIALSEGASFGDVGRLVGISRQAARKRWGAANNNQG